jgi:hypothetical protein
MNAEKTRPVRELKLGALRATIWRNETESGVVYNTVFSRIYKSGDRWKNSDSFGTADLLSVAKLANEAHTHIYNMLEESAE